MYASLQSHKIHLNYVVLNLIWLLGLYVPRTSSFIYTQFFVLNFGSWFVTLSKKFIIFLYSSIIYHISLTSSIICYLFLGIFVFLLVFYHLILHFFFHLRLYVKCFHKYFIVSGVKNSIHYLHLNFKWYPFLTFVYIYSYWRIISQWFGQVTWQQAIFWDLFKIILNIQYRIWSIK